MCSLRMLRIGWHGREGIVSALSASARERQLQRALCILVVALMVAATLYTAWIAISNFSRIGV